MPRPIVRIFAVFLLTGIIWIGTSNAIDRGLWKYYCQSNKRLTEVFDSTTYYDILFIGSSRTKYNVDPKIIDSISGLNSYNAGYDGGKMAEFELTLKGYLAHHSPPKMLVLTLDLHSFIKPSGIFDYPLLYHFLNNENVVFTLSKYGHNVALIKAIPFIWLTDLDDYFRSNAVKGLLGRGSEISKGDFEYKGYVSNGEEFITKQEQELASKDLGISDEAIASLNEIIEICKERNINIVFTYAPEYELRLQKGVRNANTIFSIITQIANKNNIKYLRDDSLELCKNPKLFANNAHFNKTGAIVYSAVLAKELNIILGHNTDTTYLSAKSNLSN